MGKNCKKQTPQRSSGQPAREFSALSSQITGTLPDGERVASHDHRARESTVREPRRVKAPDGISGDF